MAQFAEIFHSLVVKRLNQVFQFATQAAPKVALSLIILLIGWLSALLLKKIVIKLLKALGFDIVSEKTGLKSFLARGGITRTPSSVIGLGFYWLIIFSALVMVFNTLELEVASQLVKQAVFFLPRIVVAAILFALGIFLSQFMDKFVQKTARLANIPMPGLLGKAAGYIIIALAAMIALNYLGVAVSLIAQYAFIIFGVLPLAACLIFLIGGREIVASILAGRFLAKEYKKGERIEFDSISGEIESVGVITTTIRSNEGYILIPNSELAKKTIKKEI